jgi:outer membrane receptor protein involved in Fe transport
MGDPMYRRILAGLVLLLPCAVNAQISASVSGRAMDASSGEPVPFASVTASRQGEEGVVTGVVAEEDGRFVIRGLPEGRFLITADSVGHEPSQIELVVGELNDVYDLGPIDLRPSQSAVEQVVVVGQQLDSGATIDRRVFSMADNPIGSTGSLLDAMRTLPGLSVDQEGRVLLRGSDQVSILIDGRYSSLAGFGNQTGLDSVPAANIDRIEIINNPSAAFDSSGMAGVINIIYREDAEEGLNLEAGFTIGSGTLSKQKPDLPTDLGSFSQNQKIIPSFNLNYNAEDRRYFLQSEFLFQDDLPNNEFTTRYYDDGSIVVSQVPENRDQDQYIINGGMERFLEEGRSFTASAVIDFETHIDVAQVPFIDQATMTRNRYWYWREKEDTGYFNVNFEYEKQFEEVGRELSMSLQYVRGWEDEAYFLNEESLIRVGTDMTHLKAEENTLPFEIDYVKPLANGRLESGGRLQRRWIPITYDVMRGTGSVIYDGLGDWSEWSEDIYAGYVNLVREGARYGLEAGFRLEQTDVTYDLPPENIYYSQSDAYDYFEIYPSVGITYYINDRVSFSAHVNRRVDRPGEPELRIFPKYDDPELLKVGNPYLRPQFTETVDLSVERVWDRGSALLSAYVRDIENPFTRVFAIDPTNTDYNIINKIYQNVGSGSQQGIELILSQDIGQVWTLTGSINVYEKTIDADVVTLLFPVERPFNVLYSQDNTWDFSLNNSVNFLNGMQLQLSFSYYGERNIAQGTEAARSSIDLGFAMPVLDGAGELTVSATDIFNNFGLRQYIVGNGFNAVYENYYETQVVSVGITRKF